MRGRRKAASAFSEVRAIVETIVRLPARVRLGSLLCAVARDTKLSNADIEALEGAIAGARVSAPHDPIRLD